MNFSGIAPMCCNDDYVRKIGPYVDGELPAGERESVENHLEECPECRRTALEFGTLDRAMGRLEPPSVSSREWTATLETVTRKVRPVPFPIYRRPWAWVAPVASLAALILLAFFVVRALQTGSDVEERSRTAIEVEDPPDGADARSRYANKTKGKDGDELRRDEIPKNGRGDDPKPPPSKDL